MGSPGQDSCPYKKRKGDQSSLSLPCQETARTCENQEGGFSPAFKSAGTLILDFPLSKSWRKYISVIEGTQSMIFCC